MHPLPTRGQNLLRYKVKEGQLCAGFLTMSHQNIRNKYTESDEFNLCILKDSASTNKI